MVFRSPSLSDKWRTHPIQTQISQVKTMGTISTGRQEVSRDEEKTSHLSSDLSPKIRSRIKDQEEEEVLPGVRVKRGHSILLSGSKRGRPDFTNPFSHGRINKKVSGRLNYFLQNLRYFYRLKISLSRDLLTYLVSGGGGRRLVLLDQLLVYDLVKVKTISSNEMELTTWRTKTQGLFPSVRRSGRIILYVCSFNYVKFCHVIYDTISIILLRHPCFLILTDGYFSSFRSIPSLVNSTRKHNQTRV